MKREFSTNLILLIGINLLVKPIYIFGIDRTVQNVVGPEIYGLYFALFNFTYLFYIINDFGLQNYTNRHIAQNRDEIRFQLPNILGIKSLLTLVYFIVMIGSGWWLGFFPQYWKLILLMGLNQSLIALMFYLRANLSGLGFYRQDILISVMDRGLLIIMVGSMLLIPAWRATFQIEWFVVAQTISLSATIALLLVVLFKKAQKITWEFDTSQWKKILKNAAPFALVIALMTFYTRLDAVMIKHLLGADQGNYEAGVYASSYRLLDAFNMMGFAIAGLLLPIFSRMFKKNEPIKQFFSQSLSLIIAISASVAIGCFFFRQPIMDLLYTNSTSYWGELLAFLLPTFIFTSGTYIAGTFLTASGDLAKLNKLLIVGVILNFSLNLILIPQYFGVGAAASTLFTQSIMFILQLEFCRRVLKGKVAWKNLINVLFFMAIGIFICYGLSIYSSLPWLINLILGITSILMVALLLKIIHPNFLKSLINSEN